MSAPEWYGRKASTRPLPEEFIRAATVPRPDGRQALTPPPDGLEDRIVRRIIGGVAALASLMWLAWWLAQRV